jgi:hypothetical protein
VRGASTPPPPADSHRYSGHPTPAGQTGLEILRSEGKVQSTPDDITELKLGRWLREWAGSEDDPIHLNTGKRA